MHIIYNINWEPDKIVCKIVNYRDKPVYRAHTYPNVSYNFLLLTLALIIAAVLFVSLRIISLCVQF